MLTIRLQRKGKKNQPFFKIVVTEAKRSSTRGRFVEELGFYNPLTKERSLNKDRAKYWLSVGAQPSDTIYNMLVGDSVVEGKKRPKHKKSKKKQPEAEAAPAAAAVVEDTASQPKADQPQEAPSKEEPKEEKPAVEPASKETKKEDAPSP